MVKKTERWNGEEIFKILDKDMGQLSYTGYTTYDAAKEVCEYKNSLDSTSDSNS